MLYPRPQRFAISKKRCNTLPAKPEKSETDNLVEQIKAKTRAKLAWIIPLSGLLLTPFLGYMALYTGLFFGFTFTILGYRDVRKLGKHGIWSHVLAGILVIVSQLLMILITFAFFQEALPIDLEIRPDQSYD